MDKANIKKLGYIGRKPGSKRDSDSWYTPNKYLESVRVVLGGIDLDPFSSEEANKVVKAKMIYTKEDTGLNKTWKAKSVFMNPPYSGKPFLDAAGKYRNEFAAGSFEQGIVLVNNVTETRAFRLLAERSSSVCFTDHRIKFESKDGKSVSGNTRAQAFFYHGKKEAAFKKEFRKYGVIMKVIKVSK